MFNEDDFSWGAQNRTLKRNQQAECLSYLRADNRYLNRLSLNDDSFAGFSLSKTPSLNTKNAWERNFFARPNTNF